MPEKRSHCLDSQTADGSAHYRIRCGTPGGSFDGSFAFQYLRKGNIDVRLPGASCYPRSAISTTSPRSIGADHRRCRKARVVEIVSQFRIDRASGHKLRVRTTARHFRSVFTDSESVLRIRESDSQGIARFTLRVTKSNLNEYGTPRTGSRIYLDRRLGPSAATE